MDDELEEIRKQKLESLKERADGDGQSEAGRAQGKTPAEPIHVDGPDHLREVVASSDVVLVDFYADWCGPCKMLAPVVETLAAETGAAVAKVDVDANQDLAAQYGVRGVPTIVLFSNGEVVENVSGVRGEDELRSMIDRYA